MRQINKCWGMETLISKGECIIKHITASADLSLQMHPNKTEKFYALGDCRLTLIDSQRFNDMSYEDFCNEFKDPKVTELMSHPFELHEGDEIYCFPGTIHCIHGGSNLIEVSWGEEITWRLYDFNRTEPGRSLHLSNVYNYIRSTF